MANGHLEIATAHPLPGVRITGLVIALLRAALVARVVTQLQLKGTCLKGVHVLTVGRTGEQAGLACGTEVIPECQGVLRANTRHGASCPTGPSALLTSCYAESPLRGQL